MAFRVEILPQALDDLDAIASYIAAASSFDVAERWFNAIMQDIASLKRMPDRCVIAAESKKLGSEVRVLFHGRKNRAYKIFFTIDHGIATAGMVRVLHIRHWARRPAEADELQDRIGEGG